MRRVVSAGGRATCRPSGWVRWVLLAGLAVAVPGSASASEDVTAELARALGSLGSPGLLWGRLAVEEESPDGPWTPLAGVEVFVYPYVPAVAAELERIRRSARDSGTQFETAVARVQGLLHAYKAQVDGAAGRPPSPERGSQGEGLVRRRVSDAAGVFVFDDLPAGDWLLVAVRVTSYRAAAPRSEGRIRPRGREGQFLPRPTHSPAQEAEVWVTRVRLAPGERTRLDLTERARWLVGPIR